jgi:hypothetical protein
MVGNPKEWKWSSYRATAGFDKTDRGFETEWLLKQFHEKSKIARKLYRKYVLEGAKIKESPLDQAAGDLLVGTTEFKESLRERLKGRKADELTDDQTRLTRLNPRDVLLRTAKWYGVKIEEVRGVSRRPNEARDMAAWCMRRICRSRLSEIGTVLGVRYSTVSHALSRMRAREKSDRKYVQKIFDALRKT